jgi:hypothetical protein
MRLNRRRKLPKLCSTSQSLMALFLILIMTQYVSGKYLCSSFTSIEDIAKKITNCSQTESSSDSSELKAKQDAILKLVSNLLTENRATESASQRSVLTNTLDLINILNSNEQFKRTCSVTFSEIFSSCQFAAQVIDDDEFFKINSILAAQIASKLTALIINEKAESKVFLTRPNIYSLLRLSLVDNENVYDAKIVFNRFNDQDKIMFHAYKNLITKCNDLSNRI